MSSKLVNGQKTISVKARRDFSFNAVADDGTKMLEINSNVLVISVRVNALNPPVKRERNNKINTAVFKSHTISVKMECFGGIKLVKIVQILYEKMFTLYKILKMTNKWKNLKQMFSGE